MIFLLILLQLCQSRGWIISDLCRSQSLGTSHSLWVQEEDKSSRTCVDLPLGTMLYYYSSAVNKYQLILTNTNKYQLIPTNMN